MFRATHLGARSRRAAIAALAPSFALLAACAESSPTIRQPDAVSSSGDAALPPRYDFGLLADGHLGDDGNAGDRDATEVGDGGPAACPEHAPRVVIDEVAMGQPDYIALRNISDDTVDLDAHRIVLAGIEPDAPLEHHFDGTRELAPEQRVFLFEYEKGSGTDDINIGGNIPFFDGPPTANHPNAVVLYDDENRVVDYVAIGDAAIALPPGVSFAPLPWPTPFDATTKGLVRRETEGRCPAFAASDWHIAELSR